MLTQEILRVLLDYSSVTVGGNNKQCQGRSLLKKTRLVDSVLKGTARTGSLFQKLVMMRILIAEQHEDSMGLSGREHHHSK